MWGLGDEGIAEAMGMKGVILDSQGLRNIIKATLRQVYEEGKKPCPHGLCVSFGHDNSSLISRYRQAKKRECLECIAELRKEVGL